MQESAVDFQEIEEALVIVKQRKEAQNQELDFLQKVDDEKHKGIFQPQLLGDARCFF